MPISLLFVGRIPLLNPAFLNPNPLPNSKVQFFVRRGFTPSANISNNESSRLERRNTQRARCPDSLHLSLRGAKRRGNLTSMVDLTSPALVCRLTGWTKAQPYGGVYSLRKRLSTGQQDANEPSFRRPDSAVESGFSQSQYIAEFKSAILRTEGFTASTTCRFREGKV